MKEEDNQYNCFMVYATDLSLAAEHDIDGLPVWNTGHEIDETTSYLYSSTSKLQWKWTEIEERYCIYEWKEISMFIQLNGTKMMKVATCDL